MVKNSKNINQKKIYNSIVKIITTNVTLDTLIPYNISKQEKSIGAGFFIDKNGNVLTAAHVVKDTIEIWVRIPEYGKKIYRAEIVCVYPDFDLAIIRVVDINNKYYLKLGNSEDLELGQSVYALGYPDNSEYPMRTTGTVSGRRDDYIQTDTPINKGNSGGPLLNIKDEVIGVNSAVVAGSEDSSLIVPINSFKNVKNTMLNSKKRIIHKNVLGILLVNGTDNYREMYDITGDCKEGQIIKKILKNSPLENIADVGDVLCYIDNYKIDYYGEIDVEWEDGKVPLDYIVKRTKPGGDIKISFFSIKRKKKITKKITLKSFMDIYPIRQVFPHVERIDFEVFGGLIVTNLSLNHILKNFQHLIYLIVDEKIYQPYLLITHIFENSKISEYNTISKGSLINKVNDIKVRTLNEYRNAIKNPIKRNDKQFIVIETINRDKVILNLKKLMKQEKNLISQYGYDPSKTYFFYGKDEDISITHNIYKEPPILDIDEEKEDSKIVIKLEN